MSTKNQEPWVAELLEHVETACAEDDEAARAFKEAFKLDNIRDSWAAMDAAAIEVFIDGDNSLFIFSDGSYFDASQEGTQKIGCHDSLEEARARYEQAV